jgi:hypothetical protein
MVHLPQNNLIARRRLIQATPQAYTRLRLYCESVFPGSAGVSPALLQPSEKSMLYIRHKRAGETPALPAFSPAWLLLEFSSYEDCTIGSLVLSSSLPQ